LKGQTSHQTREPIAIVGLGCRLPGAASPSDLWRLLMEGRDAITPIPRDRVDLEGLYDPRPATPGRSMTKWGGVVDGLESFDASFFNLSPREAELVDPGQRLLLETAWEALEDAGIAADLLEGSETGVFIGQWLNEYENRMVQDLSKVNFYMTLGTGRYSASGRLSYFLGLLGPSITIDTACSSSLVAVNLACRSLWSGESNLALAGGVNTILEPYITVAYSQSKMMAADGKCKFGDARANGFVRSDGVGLIALERLSDAEAAGHHIYAVILGGAVNNDGRGSGFLATPAQDGQEDLLRKAYRDAGVTPGTVQYVEAHGTGTPAGDPVEIGALGAVLGEGRPAGERCRVGSVKTNIGHTEGAAGVTGLIKVALALEHGIIPKSLHFEQPNPSIPWATLPLTIQTEPTPWPAGRDGAIAGVSAFGISGTNAHMVLQAYSNGHARPSTTARSVDRVRLLPLSAQTPDALSAVARSWASYLRQADNTSTFRDICYTAATGRAHLDQRLTVAARTREEAAEQLDAFITGEARPGLVTGRRSEQPRKAVFIFPGQGSQWLGMGRGLVRHEPAFAAAIERCDATVRALTGWSVLDELRADEVTSRLTQIDVVQPVLFSIQVALAALWRSWGIEPSAVVGHSMGEVAAAHVAGALSLENAAQIICRRSVLLRRTSGKGAMAVVELSLEDAKTALRGYEARLSVAVSNSPRSTVLSGDPDALDAVLATLEKREVFCRRVKVDVASHSPQMDPLRADLFASLEGLSPRSASIAFHSTVEARQLDGRELEPAYWVRNLREPVLFATTIQQLIATGHNAFIEMSPHPLLVGAIQEMLRDESADGIAIASTRRDEDEPSVIQSSLGALHVAGVPVPWSRVFEADSRLAPAPLYPWQRERFWYDRKSEPGTRRSGTGDLLGPAFRPAQQAHLTYWEFDVSVESLPSLTDHRVRGSIVVPAAFFTEATLEAAARAFATNKVSIERAEFSAALVLAEDAAQSVQILFSSAGPGVASFRVLSRKSTADATEGWVEHVQGMVRAETTPERPSLPGVDSRRAQCDRRFDGGMHYAAMTTRGLSYGPAYRHLEEGWQNDRLLIARVSQPAPPGGAASDLQVHAAILDACFQALASTIPTREGLGRGDTYVPTALASLHLYARPDVGADVWCHVEIGHQANVDADTFEGDVVVTDISGAVLFEARGLRLFRLERELDTQLRSALHRLDWVETARPAREVSQPGSWLVVGTSGVSSSLAARLRARGAQVLEASPATAVASAHTPSLRGVIDTTTIGVTDPTDTTQLASSLALAQALASADRTPIPRLWFVTGGAQAVDGEHVTCLAGSALWGLRSVIAAEHPQLRCSTIDVGDATSTLDALVEELLDDGGDDQVAVRTSGRYVRRLRQGAPDPSAVTMAPAAGRPYRVTTTSPGILDALTPVETPRRDPSGNQVEIEIAAVGLNFVNILSALAVYPGVFAGYKQGLGPLAFECVGRVSRVGRSVTTVKPGDRVMSWAYECLATHALTHERMVWPIPNGLSFVQAATVPVAFLTAYYALHQRAQMRAGERVLIHSAAGGVGQAAMQLAHAAGVEIFATAGTEEKRARLRELGAAWVGDSHTLDWARDIPIVTRGEGVDIVLNSLAGDAIPAGLSILRAGGRFVELGKKDLYADRLIGLRPLRQNMSYCAIDVDLLAQESPDTVDQIFSACLERYLSAGLQPLPAEVFPVADVASAFRKMAQGAHTGKIVVEIDRDDVLIRPRATARPSDWHTGTYLITGGTGGLGLEIARWMVQQGARDLVLMSRRGESSQPDPRVQALRDAGTNIIVARGDVAKRDDVAAVLADIAARGATLKGVVHAAGLLDDAMLAELDAEKLRRPFAPKVNGAWHLHELTAESPLDFFILFSSVAAFIGSAGQANYAAANAWLDSLAAYRRSIGLPAISINWGPWSEVGLAAERTDRGDRLAASGLKTFAPELGVAAFGEIIDRNPVQVAVMPFDVERWCDSYPAARKWSLFGELMDAASASGSQGSATSASLRDELMALPAGRRRRTHLETALQQQVAQVLKLAPARIDLNKPLRSMGLDSLMALELRNRLEAATSISVPATVIWNYPTITLLAAQLATRMGLTLEEGAEQASPATDVEGSPAQTEELGALLAEIEALSDDDARRLLAEER
jgi:acyl transferase domain-containing protein/NADPH:quinone reductase-like Zn-dependent oxidoreductase/acyl carrier protein